MSIFQKLTLHFCHLVELNSKHNFSLHQPHQTTQSFLFGAEQESQQPVHEASNIVYESRVPSTSSKATTASNAITNEHCKG